MRKTSESRTQDQSADPSGHRQRLKERFLREGLLGMREKEILELLLTYAIPRRDVGGLAEELIRQFGSLRGLFAASVVELTDISGVGRHTAALLRLAGELVARCTERPEIPAEIIRESKQLERFLVMRFSALQEEKHLVIFLDSQWTVLGEEMVGAGTVDETVLFPREIIRSALAHNASALLLAHNHLHGPPLPSLRDREQAERLRDILMPFDILVRDSIVVGKNRCFSVFKNSPL